MEPRAETHAPIGPSAALERIVVATDLRASGELALARARLLPLGEGAAVDVVHVAGPGPIEDPDGLSNRLCEGPWRAHVLYGRVAPSVVRFADAARADLIVTGAHVERGVRDLVRPTQVQRIVLDATAPVLVVRHAPARPYRRPLVLVEPDGPSVGLLALARRLTGGKGRLRIVLCVGLAYRGFLTPELDASEVRQLARAIGRADLRRLEAERLALGWPGTRLSVRAGDPGSIGRRAARRHRADVVVLSRPRSRWSSPSLEASDPTEPDLAFV